MDTKQLRQKILSLAIRGKLVPQDPSEEPASVLLGRIREAQSRHGVRGGRRRVCSHDETSARPHYGQVPFELPAGWEWCRLEEIGEIITGNTPSKAIPEYYGGKIPFFKPSDLNLGKDIRSSEDHLSELGFQQARKLPAHSILVICIGATIGKVGIITVAGSCNQQINAIIPHGEILSEYIYYVCISNYMQAEIIRKASATTLPILNKRTFKNLLLPLPPLGEQRRIVSAIEQWFSLIGVLEQGQGELERLIRQARAKVLDLALRGKLVPQDPTEEPASKLLQRILPDAKITGDNGHYPHLPAGWTLVKLQQLCSLTDGAKESGVEKPYLDVKYLRGERLPKRVLAGKRVAAGELLILVDGENSGEIFRTPEEGYQGSTVKRLVINTHMCPEYLVLVIQKHRQTLRENKVGSAVPHLDKKLFKTIDVPIPPYQEQQRIVYAVQYFYTQLDTLLEQL